MRVHRKGRFTPETTHKARNCVAQNRLSGFSTGVFTPDVKLWDRCQPHCPHRFHDCQQGDFSGLNGSRSLGLPPLSPEAYLFLTALI
ncbi:hypothetical protein E2C01_058667 [Portunus trituberculatus]|uniref:Uncharacterized protein n=1 Tax=Portunus trituberculatus TaxID=210409 RepID=A0A5B7H3N4_PORTR|nr:hypothetical protein [Portunus trituberculatus]